MEWTFDQELTAAVPLSSSVHEWVPARRMDVNLST
jgi:hypothetical protein